MTDAHSDPYDGTLTDLPDNVTISYAGGSCPYQISGLYGDLPFYFRARGQRWRFSIQRPGQDPVGPNPLWSYEEAYPGEQFAAGYITNDEARDFLLESLERFEQSGIKP